jgi:hypothetical protein
MAVVDYTIFIAWMQDKSGWEIDHGYNETNALMSLDFYPMGTTPKRSVRKILERIIPPPSGDRDKLHFVRFTTALRAWHNSSSKLQFTLFLKLGSHYQRVSIPFRSASGIIRLALQTYSDL